MLKELVGAKKPIKKELRAASHKVEATKQEIADIKASLAEKKQKMDELQPQLSRVNWRERKKRGDEVIEKEKKQEAEIGVQDEKIPVNREEAAELASADQAGQKKPRVGLPNKEELESYLMKRRHESLLHQSFTSSIKEQQLQLPKGGRGV